MTVKLNCPICKTKHVAEPKGLVGREHRIRVMRAPLALLRKWLNLVRKHR